MTYEGFGEGRLEGTYGRRALDDAYTAASVGEVDEELVAIGGCDSAPHCRRGPRLTTPRAADLAYVDGAVEGPVDHVVGGEDDE